MLTRLTSLTAGLAIAATLAVSGSVAAPAAQAHHWSIDHLPRVSQAFQVGVTAWRGYLGHCVASGIAIYGYDTPEYTDLGDAYAFVPVLSDCSVYFNVDQADNYRYTWFCSVMVHEMGHVAGYEHTRDRNDIMNGPGEIYWRKCLTRKQRKRYRRQGKIIDRSIAQWTKTARLSSAELSPNSHLGAVDDHAAAEAFEEGRIDAHPIVTLPVR